MTESSECVHVEYIQSAGKGRQGGLSAGMGGWV